jgi:hypothetical protein
MMPENSAAQVLSEIIAILEPLPRAQQIKVMRIAAIYLEDIPAPAKRPYNRKPKEPTLPLTEAK